MNASIRTLVYAGVAVVCAGAAYVTHRGMQPPDLSGFDLVGQEFYPRFTQPQKAARLRVAAYDDLKEQPLVFTVEQHGETWRIPSHHDYPAEAKQRLAETAASVMGVKREAVAGRRQAEHERYGVVDPLDETSTAIRGRGQRITLYDDAGKDLVDLVIGKEVEGQVDQYYVRIPSEKETYRAALNVRLSTKFSDWIEPDLLKLSASDLVALNISKPIIEEKVVQTPLGPRVSEEQVGEDKVQLTREESGGDWKLQDLDDATEEFDDAPVSQVVSTIGNLKIIGVRPKPRGINADFTFDIPENLRGDRQQAMAFARERLRELQGRGFAIFADDEGRPYLSAREGELVAATKDGVVYNLHFGNRFDGSLDEIEFGAASKEEKNDDEQPGEGENGEENPGEPAEASKSASDESSANETKGEARDADDKSVQQGRYVLVRAEFDPQHVGGEPVEPVEPEKPAGDDAPKEPADDAPDSDSDDRPSSGEQTGDDEQQEDAGEDADSDEQDDPAGEKKEPADEPADEDKPEEKPADDKKSPEQTAYEEALKEYQSKKFKYDSDKQDYDRKIEEGKKKVRQLNDRFQEWYYVISAESFETLRISRSKLVKTKDVAEEAPVEAPDPPSAEPEEPPAGE